MKIRFQQTGGIAGLSRGCEIDVADLPAALQKLAAKLVIPQRAPVVATPQARDLQSFTFQMKHGNESSTVEFDDLTIPDKLQPLLQHLMKKSKPTPIT